MAEQKSRKSLSHLADKFNTAAPPGYVAGRGRGVSGFSKPEEPPPKRGGAAPSEEGAGEDNSGAASSWSRADGKVEGETADTSTLELGQVERFEKEELSMDKKEAGFTIEAFNMNAERKEGRFDDDFNFVWNRKGEDPDDIRDAWLTGDVDGEGESEEKVAKRRKLLQKQLDAQQAPADAPADRGSLLAQAISHLQPGESVARALRRLGSKPARPGGKRAAPAPGDEAADDEAAARKKAFDALTDAADDLLRAGMLGIFSETYESLSKSLGEHRPAASSSAADASSSDSAAAAAAGIDPQAHAAAVAGGFAFDAGRGLYYNSSSGLMFDARTSLYWPADGDGSSYFYWDAQSGQFVPAAVGSQANAVGAEPASEAGS